MTNQKSTESFEFEGKVKWFDLRKKYGFITDERDNQDIYVHLDTLVQYGIFSLSPGSYIEGEAQKNNQGFITTAITSLDPQIKIFDHETAKKISEEISLLKKDGSKKEKRIFGTVKKYNCERGFGFIDAPSLEKSIFFHVSCLEKCNIPIEDIRPEQRVSVLFFENEKGFVASDIELS